MLWDLHHNGASIRSAAVLANNWAPSIRPKGGSEFMMPAIISSGIAANPSLLWLMILLAVCVFLAAFAIATLTIDPFINFILTMHNREVENFEKARKLL